MRDGWGGSKHYLNKKTGGARLQPVKVDINA